MKRLYARCLRLHPLAAAVLACHCLPAAAQGTEATLPDVVVKEAPSLPEKNQLPGPTESVTASQLADTVNVKTVEDAFKYMPGLVIRKRNIGDQFAPLATRTSGLGQSARSLIFVD